MQRRGIRLAVAAVIGVLIALAVREAMFDPRTVIYITDAPLIPAAPRPTLAELTAVLGPPADCYGKEPGKFAFTFTISLYSIMRPRIWMRQGAPPVLGYPLVQV